jgi:hypothetical protein
LTFEDIIFRVLPGRWTKEEHLAFIKGLEQYGKGWKKIAGLVKTRTGIAEQKTHYLHSLIKYTQLYR